jgi:putative nucleotidyltransferase with HDIG domain
MVERLKTIPYRYAFLLIMTLIIFIDYLYIGGKVLSHGIVAWMGISSLVTSVSICLFIKYDIHSQKNMYKLTRILLTTLQAHDTYTEIHSRSVAFYAKLIAKELRLPSKQRKSIYMGALLHDIGKIGIPTVILTKPSKLTESEYKEIKQHPLIGYDMLNSIAELRNNEVLAIIRSHHERYDGKGYPDGLTGDKIPVMARIVAVADAFDAMLSQRVYRNESRIEHAMEELRNNKGLQFDPEITDAFMRLLERDGESIVGKAMK